MMNPLLMMAAALAAMKGKSRRRKGYCHQRWNWRKGPTPKRGSRRWRVMMAYRQSIQGTA